MNLTEIINEDGFLKTRDGTPVHGVPLGEPQLYFVPRAKAKLLKKDLEEMTRKLGKYNNGAAVPEEANAFVFARTPYDERSGDYVLALQYYRIINHSGK